jgi:cytochrome c peroxidase
METALTMNAHFTERSDTLKKRNVIKILVVAAAMAITSTAYAGGDASMMGDPYISPAKKQAMMKMMITMSPDSVEASISRGKHLFNDTSLGKNKTGLSCNSCHPDGGSVGGSAAMT